jgi:2,4-dienoyl-CoA reductase-like NADH-dependent reductase (Old Yellow Enzyme family)
MLKFPHLFSPLQLRNVWIANRILSTGHDTDLRRHGLPGDELVAYQTACSWRSGFNR